MRFLNLFFAVMFLVFASLQLNDPDPVIWILIYGSMAAVCVMAAFHYYLRWLMIIQGVGYAIYAILLIPGFRLWLGSADRSLLFDDLAKMQFYYIEESREFLGLMICIAILALCWVRSVRSKKVL